MRVVTGGESSDSDDSGGSDSGDSSDSDGSDSGVKISTDHNSLLTNDEALYDRAVLCSEDNSTDCTLYRLYTVLYCCSVVK